MYFRTNNYPKTHYKNLAMLALMVILSFIGYFSTVITIYQSASH